MNKTAIDGLIFSDMMKGALSELRLYEKEIDDLNVFPVPDGDTGANMRRTLELGVQHSQPTQKLNEYLDALSTGMLLGARGNSGVILSQIFKGIALSLSKDETATEADIAKALSLGYATAYNTVLVPVEGTILTVLRDGVDGAKSAIGSGVDGFLTKLISESNKVLKNTPELLPVLKEAGVVDSGGFGLIKIYDGMLKAYRGVKIEYTPSAAETGAPDLSSFDENSDFTFGYCMEFTLQLLKTKTDVDAFDDKAYTKEISAIGESIVVIRDKSRVRVHIHTYEPEKVIELCRKYGEFVFFKLDNMALQHNETVYKKSEKSHKHKELEIISVAGSDGLSSVFDGLGSGIIIDTEADMNVSVQDVLSAIESADADSIVILPNDKNVVQTVAQAVKLYGGNTKIDIVPTKSIAEGYFALASDMPGCPTDDRIEAMKDGAAGVETVYAARCTRSRSSGGVKCAAGDFALFVAGKLVKSDKDLFSALCYAINAVEDIEEKEAALVFMGQIDGGDELLERLGEAFPDLQIDCIDGVFSDEKLVIGIV
ncbi:MAG: DAK2 domain-containing protein [Clostridiales bacterium]|nr:DAK2 domain-containing protein [Clostridiales bacterium]